MNGGLVYEQNQFFNLNLFPIESITLSLILSYRIITIRKIVSDINCA